MPNPARDPLDTLAALNASAANDTRELLIGSDVELAACVRRDLEQRFGEVVFTEGTFWRYGQSHWHDIPPHELRLAVHGYDGATFKTRGGAASVVRLNKARVDSTLYEMAASLTQPEFFSHSVTGINCTNGFIRFTGNGTPALIPHDPKHRCRHTLPGAWRGASNGTPPAGSLLHRLLDGVFKGDADAAAKTDVLAEAIGVAALGYATKLRQPRALILKGETAENGKSQILDLARILLPESAVSSVTAGRMGDERHVVGLIGKLLNASDELSSAQAIASDTFKTVITGEPTHGRDVYKSRIEFRAAAQHIFATNTLPIFAGGMDRGVRRRLLVISFNRVIPHDERIEGIGRLIGDKEADLLLAWAVAGASRILKQRVFTAPPSAKAALDEWLFGADPVMAWLAEQVECKQTLDGATRIRTSHAYERFRDWSFGEGYTERTLPSINAFVQRVQANAKGIEYRRTREGRYFYGMVIGGHTTSPKGW